MVSQNCNRMSSGTSALRKLKLHSLSCSRLCNADWTRSPERIMGFDSPPVPGMLTKMLLLLVLVLVVVLVAAVATLDAKA